MRKKTLLILIFFLKIFSVWSQDITLFDPLTQKNELYNKVELWENKIPMIDEYVDNIVYIKKNDRFYKKVTNGKIDLRSFGVNNESKNVELKISKATSLALKLNQALFIPRELSNLKINNEINIFSSIISDGAILKFPSLHKRFFNLQNNDIKIEGLVFQIDNSTRLVNAPIAIECNGYNNIILKGNKIINGRINSSSSNRRPKNLKIENNTFISDFSNFSRNEIQNDILYLYNVVGLSILNNSFSLKNVNRGIKISSSSIDGKFTTKNILISGNKFQSETDSKKQLIDLFQHSENVKIVNNTFQTKGHLSVIENKTTSKRLYRTNLQVTSNIFITDGACVRVFGTFGSKNNNQSGFQDVLFTNNKITGNLKGGVIFNAAHFHRVNMSNNTFNGLNGDTFVRIAGIDNLSIQNNKFNNTKIVFMDEKQIGNEPYNNDFNEIEILNNSFNKEEGVVNIVNTKSIRTINYKGNKHSGKNRNNNTIKYQNGSVGKINF